MLVVLATVALVLFYGVGGPFGTINDGLNLAVGPGSSALATATIPRARAGALDLTAGVLGILGGGVFAHGAYHVLTDRTGWFLAGLVSGVGAGFMGTWLLLLNRPRPAGSRTPVGSPRLGRLAGAVMVLGLLGIPGWMEGVDDWAAAPWYVSIGMLSWLGTYGLYPAWCFRVSRAG